MPARSDERIGFVVAVLSHKCCGGRRLLVPSPTLAERDESSLLSWPDRIQLSFDVDGEP
jgi:hypothetical protein